MAHMEQAICRLSQDDYDCIHAVTGDYRVIQSDPQKP